MSQLRQAVEAEVVRSWALYYHADVRVACIDLVGHVLVELGDQIDLSRR